MKPLSEQELYKNINKLMVKWLEGTRTPGAVVTISDFTENVVKLYLQDRKAWGEYVIGEDKWSNDTGTIGTNNQTIKKSTYIHVRNALRAEQRKRNQGEKTDE